MNRWIAELLEAALAERRVVVALNADGWLDSTDIHDADVEVADDWWALRRAWERLGRHRPEDGRPLVIVITNAALAKADRLPWDILSGATCLRLRPPIDAGMFPLLREVPENQVDAVLDSLEGHPSDPVGALLAEGWQLTLPVGSLESAEIAAVATMIEDQTAGPETWSAVRERLRHPVAIALAGEPSDAGPLQAAWADWCASGDASAWATTMTAIGPRLMPLVERGLLDAPQVGASLPTWVRYVARKSDLRDEARALLTDPPGQAVTRVEWLATASWWGQVRALIAQAEVDEALERDADEWWLGADAAFGAWLQAGGLSATMTAASASWPSTVAGIAPFLARRVRANKAKRVLLIVVDGMGFPQWDVIKASSQLEIVEEGACFAMVPTLTRVSRQAIFAGGLPLRFPDSLDGTSKEKQLWQSFWRDELGEGVPPAWYTKLIGSFPRDVPILHGAEVAAAVVVNAVDEMMHGAVMGDRQLALDARSWAQHGFLDTLVGNAATAGFEVWVTADHGNLEATALGSPGFEGRAVEQAGSRVRWYATRDLAEGSAAAGVYWPNPPGMPTDRCFAVFAPGRGGYFGKGPKVAHGGLSFDEVIVPLARVTR